MAKQQRFHLFRREEQDIDNNYVHRVLVLSVDGNEIELIAKDTDNLIDLLIEGRKAMGWQSAQDVPVYQKELVESVIGYIPELKNETVFVDYVRIVESPVLQEGDLSYKSLMQVFYGDTEVLTVTGYRAKQLAESAKIILHFQDNYAHLPVSNAERRIKTHFAMPHYESLKCVEMHDTLTRAMALFERCLEEYHNS